MTDEWQDIATVPFASDTDLEGILVCIMDESEPRGYEAIEWVSHWKSPDHAWLNLNSGNYFRPSYGAQFTHWRYRPNLPEPPK